MNTISTPSSTRHTRDRIVASSLKKNCHGKTCSVTVLSLALASVGAAAAADTSSPQYPTFEQSQEHRSSSSWKNLPYDTWHYVTTGKFGTALASAAASVIAYKATRFVERTVGFGDPRTRFLLTPAEGLAATAFVGTALYGAGAFGNTGSGEEETPRPGEDTSGDETRTDEATTQNGAESLKEDRHDINKKPPTKTLLDELESNSGSPPGHTPSNQTPPRSDDPPSENGKGGSEPHPSDEESIRDKAAAAVKNAKDTVKGVVEEVKDTAGDIAEEAKGAVKNVADEISSSLTDDEPPPQTDTPTSTEEDGQETTTPNTDSEHLAASDGSDTQTPDSEQDELLELIQELASMLNESLSVTDTAIRPAAGSYMSNAWAANTMFQMNLNDRLGSYYQGEASPHQGSAWVRYSGSRGHLKDTSGELRTAGDKNTVMMGVDILTQSSDARDQFTVGIMGGYGHYSGHTKSNSFNYSTKGKVNGYSVGLYGTYQKDVATQHGFYADTWALWNQFDNRIKGGDLPAEKYDSKGMTASLELGYNIPLSDGNNVKYVLQPHAQVMYQNVRSDNFRQADNTSVNFLNRSRVQTALGVRAAAHITTGLTSVITPHIEANWLHANKGYGVNMDNIQSNMNSGRNIGQVKLGVQGDMNRRVSLNIELFHNQGNAGYHETGGNVTAKYRF